MWGVNLEPSLNTPLQVIHFGESKL